MIIAYALIANACASDLRLQINCLNKTENTTTYEIQAYIYNTTGFAKDVNVNLYGKDLDPLRASIGLPDVIMNRCDPTDGDWSIYWYVGDLVWQDVRYLEVTFSKKTNPTIVGINQSIKGSIFAPGESDAVGATVLPCPA